VDVRAPARPPAGDQLVARKVHARERRLRFDRAATRTRAKGDVGHYDETSESQLIARWRSRARSPMSMPVAVAT